MGRQQTASEEVLELKTFYAKIKNDNRIGISHISLYMALFHLYILNNFSTPVNITRSLLMDLAKISGLATYHKCIKELHEYGYIRYEPSYNPGINSKVYLVKFDTV